MERVIYSPTLENLQEAEEIAKQTMLPILIGDSPSTEQIVFDRQKVQVVEIPRFLEIDIAFGNVKSGMHQGVLVVDEFCENNISQYSVTYNNSKIEPMYTEKYKIKWSFICGEKGESSAHVFFNDTEVKELRFNVY